MIIAQPARMVDVEHQRLAVPAKTVFFQHLYVCRLIPALYQLVSNS